MLKTAGPRAKFFARLGPFVIAGGTFLVGLAGREGSRNGGLDLLGGGSEANLALGGSRLGVVIGGVRVVRGTTREI